MTIDELRERLREIKVEQADYPPKQWKPDLPTPETQHMEIDELLLEYIGDEELLQLFRSLTKWYS
jgi:hypothetical protein